MLLEAGPIGPFSFVQMGGHQDQGREGGYNFGGGVGDGIGLWPRRTGTTYQLACMEPRGTPSRVVWKSPKRGGLAGGRQNAEMGKGRP